MSRGSSSPKGSLADCSPEDAQRFAIRLLADWAQWARRWWYEPPELPGAGCFGTGYNQWGAQTNQKYVGVMATLAARGPDDQKEYALQQAVKSLEYETRTHVSGDACRTDGSQWGKTWISALGVERMMYSLGEILPKAGSACSDGLRRMVLGEAMFALDEYSRHGRKGVHGGMWGKDGNFPESNVWVGGILWRAASMYPDNGRAGDMLNRAHDYLINAISIPADANDETVVAGKPVKARHVGANFFPSYGLDHHGYLNVGYMVIVLSNVAIVHFDMRKLGVNPPESLYHHAADLWAVLRKMIFSDGRMARLGGDSRIPYTYCQEYLIPVLLLAADRFGDELAWGLLTRQLKQIAVESEANGDGSFYSRRLGHMAGDSPYYYTRLESDRACVLSMLVNYLPMVGENTAKPTSQMDYERATAGPWVEPLQTSIMHRSPSRLASLSFRAFECPQALCLPPTDGHLADWRSNLLSLVCCIGDNGDAVEANLPKKRRVVEAGVCDIDGGFLAAGVFADGDNNVVPEGLTLHNQATSRVAICALPDLHTMLVLHLCKANFRVFTGLIKGMHLSVPNDLFNGFARTVETAQGRLCLTSPAPAVETLSLDSKWACIDGRLGAIGLYGAPSLEIHRQPQRRGGIYNGLFTEEFCWPCITKLQSWDKGQVILDVGYAAASMMDAGAVTRMHQSVQAQHDGDIRTVTLVGADGRGYRFVANLGSMAARELQPGEAVLSVLDDKGEQTLGRVTPAAVAF